ncbi:ABC transporter permease [Sediminispirochaeta bajacaliforniensis]|uniref:ABC transporter permease n=1 Tax=Sediminispirochaeta bajacaliforniensis TaxID=148 RepID=UPI0003A33CE8|nr:ABC transporter permease [Sediminispirochaeta bajacaliforniensis]
MEKKTIFLLSPSAFMLISFAVVPLFIMFAYSFQGDDGSGFVGLANYARFFSKSFYLKLTLKTMRMSLLVTVISLLIAYPMAFILAKLIAKGKNIILMLIIIPFWSSQLIRAYSWMNLLRDGGILDIALQHVHLSSGEGLGILFTQTAVIIGLVHIFCPYMIITIYMTLEKIDDSLLEASRSLGARPITTFRRVILPLTETGIISGAILVFVPCLGSFVEPRILGGTQGSVIGTVIEDQFFEIYGWNFGSAIAFLLLVMVLASMGILSALRNRRVRIDG